MVGSGFVVAASSNAHTHTVCVSVCVCAVVIQWKESKRENDDELRRTKSGQSNGERERITRALTAAAASASC